MSNTKPTIVFFGNEKLCTGIDQTNFPTLQLLIQEGYKIAAVFTLDDINQPNKTSQALIEFAQEHSISLYFNLAQDEIINIIKESQAEIGVLAAYGNIVSDAVIDSLVNGIINIHPSLLPQWRGSTPIESAILSGQGSTGVSIMQLVAAMDAGPIYISKKIDIGSSISKAELARELATLGAQLLISNLPSIYEGSLKPKPQNDDNATYSKRIQKSDSHVDTSLTANVLERQIRAYADWPKSSINYKGLHVIIIDVKVSDKHLPQGKLVIHNNQLYLGCADSSLQILSLQVAGKRPMNAMAFINGYKNLL